MIDVLVFLPDLIGGGAQRTAVNIVNHLGASFRASLVIGNSDGPYDRLIQDHVRVIDLGRRRVRDCIRPLAGVLRKESPKVLFSPYPDANVALALANRLSRSRLPIVVRESNNRSAREARWGWLKDRLVRWSYRGADKVVALSKGVARDLMKRYALSPEKVVTIYNPVDLEEIERLSHEPSGETQEEGNTSSKTLKVVSVGRLVRQKGFDLLIRAFASIADREARLVLIGKGECREALIRLAEDLGVADRVSLPGFQLNPYPWMKGADLFVLSSRWEGFGHVIVEAMACGVCVLATRCPSGPDEIITDGVDGMLCDPDSVENLARRIDDLLKRPEERARLSQRGKETVRRFDARRITSQYEDVFREVLGRRACAGEPT